MVQEKTLEKISLCCMLAGITFLFILMQSYTFEEKQIQNLTNKDVGQTVVLKGTVKGIIKRTDSTTITLSQECAVPVVAFKRIAANISRNEIIVVAGKVNEDNGTRTIFADEIWQVGK